MKFFKPLSILFFFCCLTITVFSQTPIGVGNQTSTFSSMIRGYHFTAPVSFTICGLYIPDDASTGFQRVRVVKFNGGAPPAYPGTTNNFTQIFSQSNVVANTMISCNIQINAGEIIGVYGARGGNCTNSYGVANHVTSINGNTVTLQRSGMQSCPANGPMANIWSEVNYKIGRIIMYTNCCNAAPNISVSSTSVTICQGDSTTLNASSNTSGGTYLWSNGATTSSINVSPSSTTTYSVTYSVPGCPPAQDSVVVNITPVPSPIVTNVTICEGETTTLNASVNPPVTGSFSWSTGATGNNITVSPTTTTNYTCFYTLGTCPPSSSIVTVSVDPAPILSVSDHVICDGETVTLTATPDQPGGTFSWSPSGNTQQTFTSTPSSSIDYVVTYNLGACLPAIDTGSITVNPSPTIVVNDATICDGDSAVLIVTIPTSGQGGGTYLWSPGNQTSSSITVNPSISSNYDVTYTLNNCPTTQTSSVTVNQLPNVTFSSSITEGCVPFNPSLSVNNIDPSASYLWSLSNSLTFTGAVISPVFNTGGCFDVTLTATTASNCINSSTIPQFICVDEYPTAEFTPSSSMFYELSEEMSFINTSSGANTYIWDFGDQSSSVQFEPTHLFQNTTGGFLVSLYAISPLGCTDTATFVISYQEGIVYYIPNTFTPDGDNHNQMFQPVFLSGYDPNSFNMTVYNRWGETVFETNDSQIGWDGSYGLQGIDAPSGIYTYKIIFKLPTNDERRVISGHVNLLK